MGISSTASGALTGQFLMNGIFDMKVSKIKRILITRTITLIPCLFFIIFVDINKIMNLLNIMQFVQLPFVIIPLMKFVSNASIMGEDYRYKGFGFWILLFFAVVLQAINIYSIFGVVQDDLGTAIWWLVLVLILAQSGFLIYLISIQIKGINKDLIETIDEETEEIEDTTIKESNKEIQNSIESSDSAPKNRTFSKFKEEKENK